MDPKQFPESTDLAELLPRLPGDEVTPLAAAWTPSKPTIDQTRANAIAVIQQNFQYLDEQIVSGAGFVRKAGDTMTGTLYLQYTGAAYPSLAWLKAGIGRWEWRVSGAEGGSNAGANIDLIPYTDAGAAMGAALSVNRASGAITGVSSITAPKLYGTADGATPADWSSAQVQARAKTAGQVAAFAWMSPGYAVIAAMQSDTSLVWVNSGGLSVTHYAAVWVGGVAKYSPAGGGQVVVDLTRGNAFVVNVPVGGCSIVASGSFAEGVVYRILLRNTGNGTVTWHPSFKFPVGTPSPPVGAGTLGRAIVTLWYNSDDAASYCNVAQY